MLDSVKGDRQKGERDNGKELERQSKHQRNIITVDYSSTTSGKKQCQGRPKSWNCKQSFQRIYMLF